MHAGFQVVVTVLVYPALGDVPAADWERAHARHTRRITPVVGVVYAPAAAVCLWVLLAGPRTPAALVAVASIGVAAALTAVLAAPAHGRLARGYDALAVQRLLHVDRWRLGAAVVALVAAAFANG